MAAGQGGQAGSGMQAQQKMSGDTMAQVQSQGSTGQGSVTASQNGATQMLRIRTYNQTCVQDCEMTQNMTKSQIQHGYAASLSGESPGTGYCAGNGTAYNTALQQQGAESGAVQSRLSLQHKTRSGLLAMDGQMSLAGSAARSGDQDRSSARSMMKNQTHLQDGSCGNC
jgi:DNA-binding protein YbaB